MSNLTPDPERERLPSRDKWHSLIVGWMDRAPLNRTFARHVADEVAKFLETRTEPHPRSLPIPPLPRGGVLTAAPMTYDNLVNCIHAAIGSGTTPYVQARIIADAIVATFPLAEREKRLVEALEEISRGAGDFSRDPLTRAGNRIRQMKGIAKAALAAYPSVDHLAEAGHQ